MMYDHLKDFFFVNDHRFSFCLIQHAQSIKKCTWQGRKKYSIVFVLIKKISKRLSVATNIVLMLWKEASRQNDLQTDFFNYRILF